MLFRNKDEPSRVMRNVGNHASANGAALELCFQIISNGIDALISVQMVCGCLSLGNTTVAVAYKRGWKCWRISVKRDVYRVRRST